MRRLVRSRFRGEYSVIREYEEGRGSVLVFGDGKRRGNVVYTEH